MIDGGSSSSGFAWNAPSISMPAMEFAGSAIVAISLPMVVLALGLEKVQGLGFLVGQGYKVPIDKISITVGALSVVNALFGDHASQVARTGVAILGSPDAGPFGARYWDKLDRRDANSSDRLWSRIGSGAARHTPGDLRKYLGMYVDDAQVSGPLDSAVNQSRDNIVIAAGVLDDGDPAGT